MCSVIRDFPNNIHNVFAGRNYFGATLTQVECKYEPRRQHLSLLWRIWLVIVPVVYVFNVYNILLMYTLTDSTSVFMLVELPRSPPLCLPCAGTSLRHNIINVSRGRSH